jgi:amino acid transporter
MTATVGAYGYTTFLPGWWDLGTFFSYYTMVFVCPLLWGGWKLVKKTKMVKAEEADLVWERPIIDEYERSVEGEHMTFMQEVKLMMGFKKKAEAETAL